MQKHNMSTSHSTGTTEYTYCQEPLKRPINIIFSQCCAAQLLPICQNTVTESPLRKPFPCSTATKLDANTIDSIPRNRYGTNNTSSSTYLQPKSKLNQPFNPTMEHPLATNTTPHPQYHTQEEETEESLTIFSNRQCLALPEQKYDMNTIHLSTIPF